MLSSYRATAFVVTLSAVVCAVMNWIPVPWWLAWYGLAGLFTFVLFGLDKQLARAGRSRVPEKELHLWSLAGGVIGEAIAQPVFRHKTQDFRFRIGTVCVRMAHFVGWMAWWYFSRSPGQMANIQ